MAAGEYVSVQSQADTEQAELARERTELHADAQGEHEELMAIYVGRGLDPALAHQVAEQLMAHDALGAHARDELGITETLSARPLQAAMASACSFAGGAALPLLVTALAPEARLIPVVSGSSLVCLALLGGEQLAVTDALNSPHPRRENHCGRHHGTRERAASDFVDPDHGSRESGGSIRMPRIALDECLRRYG